MRAKKKPQQETTGKQMEIQHKRALRVFKGGHGRIAEKIMEFRRSMKKHNAKNQEAAILKQRRMLNGHLSIDKKHICVCKIIKADGEEA